MRTNFEPIAGSETTRLLATFGVALTTSIKPSDEAIANAMTPIIIGADMKPANALGSARLGVLGLRRLCAASAHAAPHARHCFVQTMKSLPVFRESWWTGRRCVIPAEALEAWCYESRPARIHSIRRHDGEPMGLAGLWQECTGPAGETLLSFCMLTLDATGHGMFHRMNHPDEDKRMPVILPARQQEVWLYGSQQDAQRLLVGIRAEELKAVPREETADPLSEPPDWCHSRDLFADERHMSEWYTTASEPRRRPARARPARPLHPTVPGPTTRDLFS